MTLKNHAIIKCVFVVTQIIRHQQELQLVITSFIDPIARLKR